MMPVVARREYKRLIVISVLLLIFFIQMFLTEKVFAQGTVPIAEDKGACGIGGKGLLGIDWDQLNSNPNLGCIVTLVLHIANSLLGFAIIPLIVVSVYATFILAANGWFGEIAGMVTKEGSSDAIGRAKNMLKGAVSLLIMTILLSLIVTTILTLFGADSSLFGI
jgi:hypothetical protein